MSSQPSAKKIIIVGAGLVGSLLAVRLRQLGFQVAAFEKRPDIRKSTIDGGRSINLVITSRGINALQEAGLLAQAVQKSVPVYGRMMHSRTGELAYQPYGQNQECNLSISRALLNQFLLDEAEKQKTDLHFNSSVTDIDFKNKTITTNQGQQFSYDFIFATDGSGSLIRKKFVDSDSQIKFSTDWLPVDYKELLLPLPKDAAATEQFLKKYQKDALHIWPRITHMMMALANRDGSFTVTLYLPKESQRTEFSFAQISTDQKIENLFNSEFADAKKDMPDYLNEFNENPQGNLGTVKLSKWTDGKSILFLGDAAHAIVPFFGQGTNLGFEDISTFIKLLQHNLFEWEKTFSDFEKTQKPNADAIAEMAIENWFEMSERVADPKFLLRKKVEAELEKRFPDLFKSRYGLVTYTLTPYAAIQKAGWQQDEIFADLLSELKTPDDFHKVNWLKAEDLLRTKYQSFKTEFHISHQRVTI